ncbi:MAG: hypothetical protein HYR64_07160 [Fimbriimonas ginsengisoli]|uniref:Uncharacterized protein n=1 Tax=Fimbriimonas ginsengisoli TaxID=1005039 RepID=A0A931PTY1_FIMGI|nr:hypothetical protein [Fimbriimonas ginsengisoli]
MKREISERHPIREFFSESIQASLRDCLGLRDTEAVELYLAAMLVDFVSFEGIFAIRDASGRSVQSLPELLAEGDVRLRADSFAREREVHRHIGDLLLFWSGLYPEFLPRLAAVPGDPVEQAVRQGSLSYHVVSTFEHSPYGEQAGTFRKLSVHFDEYRTGLSLLRASFDRVSGSEGFGA